MYSNYPETRFLIFLCGLLSKNLSIKSHDLRNCFLLISPQNNVIYKENMEHIKILYIVLLRNFTICEKINYLEYKRFLHKF
jgi:hypothetical protein